MIYLFDTDKTDKCTELIQRKNKKSMKVRYFPNSQSEIMERIKRRNNQENVDILLYEDAGSVIGYMELLIDEKEKYLQILAFFADRDFNYVLDQYFEHIKANYPKFKLHYVVSDFNFESIKYMEKIGASSDGIELMMYVDKVRFVPRANSDIMMMEKDHYERFINLHDKVYSDAFWTGRLILENENHFNKLIKLSNDKFIGYSVTSNFGRSEEEIYFVYSSDIEGKLDLISNAIMAAFKTADTVQLLLDESEKNEIHLLKSLGFIEKESIITFLIDSI